MTLARLLLYFSYFMLGIGAIALSSKLASVTVGVILGGLVPILKIGIQNLLQIHASRDDLGVKAQIILGLAVGFAGIAMIHQFDVSGWILGAVIAGNFFSEFFVYTILARQEGEPNERTR